MKTLNYLKEKEEYLKRKQLEECLDTNTKLPHKLRKDAKTMLDDIIYNDEEERELSWPKVFITTSHNPTNTLKQFSKHLSVLLNGKFILRSKMTECELANMCKLNSVTHLFIINESKGNPTSICLSKFPYGKTYYFNMKNLQYEKRTKSMKMTLQLIIDGLTSDLGISLKEDIRLMCPKHTKNTKNGKNDRVLAFINRGGIISLKHCIMQNKKLKSNFSCELTLYKVSSGTFEMKGDVEYQFSGFKNIVNYDVLTKKL